MISFVSQSHKAWQQHTQPARYGSSRDFSRQFGWRFFFVLKWRSSTQQFKLCACMITSSLDRKKKTKPKQKTTQKFTVSFTSDCLYCWLPLASVEVRAFRFSLPQKPQACFPPAPSPAATHSRILPAPGPQTDRGEVWLRHPSAKPFGCFKNVKGSLLGTGLSLMMTVGSGHCYFF